MRKTNTSTYDYYGVTYGNNRFVSVGTGGQSYYSTDCISWTSMSGLDSSNTYYGVAFNENENLMVALGSNGSCFNNISNSYYYHELQYT